MSGVLYRVEGITPEDHDKLQTLRRFLEQPDVTQGKLLIFSEAETTVRHRDVASTAQPSGRVTLVSRK